MMRSVAMNRADSGQLQLVVVSHVAWRRVADA
jgi:hypothetical protein